MCHNYHCIQIIHWKLHKLLKQIKRRYRRGTRWFLIWRASKVLPFRTSERTPKVLSNFFTIYLSHVKTNNIVSSLLFLRRENELTNYKPRFFFSKLGLTKLEAAQFVLKNVWFRFLFYADRYIFHPKSIRKLQIFSLVPPAICMSIVWAAQIFLFAALWIYHWL